VAIRKIRQRSDVSIVVILDERDQHEQDYRIAGAAECLLAPVNIIILNEVIQKIMRINGAQTSRKVPQADTFEVEGMIFQPRQNILSANGASIQLTCLIQRIAAIRKPQWDRPGIWGIMPL
jgi:DNA-binding response OmpR family regulator